MQLNSNQLELFRELETKLHKKEVRNSPEKVSELISDDFIEFGKSGIVYDKKITLEGLTEEKIDLNIRVSDFNAQELSSGVVLVTYRSNMINTADNQEVSVLRSSIWKLNGDKWQMVFHQGTPAKTE